MGSHDEMVELGRSILGYYGDSEPAQFLISPSRIVNDAHLPLVNGCTHHTLRLGRAYLDLHDAGLDVEAVPTLRCMFETAITAAWISETREGLPAIYNEDLRLRKALSAAMSRSASDLFREGAEGVAHIDEEMLESSADAQARHFEQRCLALNFGIDAYVIYRAMSAYCHPGATLADLYIHPQPDTPSGVVLLSVPTVGERESWLSVAVSSMIWAARALDNMKVGTPDRGFLIQAASQLGVVDELVLTPAARNAEWRARRDRKQAAWKGKRPRRKRDAPDTLGGE